MFMLLVFLHVIMELPCKKKYQKCSHPLCKMRLKVKTLLWKMRLKVKKSTSNLQLKQNWVVYHYWYTGNCVYWILHKKNLDLFLYSYEVDFYMRRKNLLLWPSVRHFDISTMFYLLTIINSIHMSIRYIQMNWKSKIPQSSTSASYLDVLLKLDSNGKITTQRYDKQDYFNFSIVNFPYLCRNISASPAYGVYISQLIRYARACSTYDQF
jgi:hypothetical protein